MQQLWTKLYLCIPIILLSCTENEPPEIVDYERALAELYREPYQAPAPEQQSLTYYEDPNDWANKQLHRPLPIENETSDEECYPALKFEASDSFSWQTYTHMAVIEMDASYPALIQQLHQHAFYNVSTATEDMEKQLYLTSFTYLPHSQKWIQNVAVAVHSFSSEEESVATDDYAQLAARMLLYGSIYEISGSDERSQQPPSGVHLYAFGLSWGHPSESSSKAVQYETSECLEQQNHHLHRIGQMDVRVLYLQKS